MIIRRHRKPQAPIRRHRKSQAPIRRHRKSQAPILKFFGLYLLAALLAGAGCDPPRPSVPTPIGALVVGAWLPAGLDTYRFSAADRQRLAALGLNQLEWLQRAEVEGKTAERRAMDFCHARGWQMPVFYEPHGYTPYDKLQHWATRSPLGAGFADSLALRVQALVAQWAGAAGLQGYLVGHEDYREEYYDALAEVVSSLGRADSLRPVLTVGRLDHYEDRRAFADAFFRQQGPPNIFQHEHYVFRDHAPSAGAGLQHRLSALLAGYDQVAAHLRAHWGRWHAIVQVHGETRDGKPYYRRPSPAEISVQVGLALTRGASGIVYFLYSSGREKVRDARGALVQTRWYEGLVDRDGAPTASYAAVQKINEQLHALSPAIAGLYFHGATSADPLAKNELIAAADADLELGFFGDLQQQTHVLVVNRRTWEQRRVVLGLKKDQVRDAATGAALTVESRAATVELAAGGFRLLAVGGD